MLANWCPSSLNDIPKISDKLCPLAANESQQCKFSFKHLQQLKWHCCFQMQVLSQQENPQADLTPLNMYNKFIERIRRHLHVVLAFSPIGDAFRSRLRMFPSLINCCTIDWFKVSKNLEITMSISGTSHFKVQLTTRFVLNMSRCDWNSYKEYCWWQLV